jgi:hypothetical protein
MAAGVRTNSANPGAAGDAISGGSVRAGVAGVWAGGGSRA